MAKRKGLTKHTALLQKRARDKEYKLRRAGASDAEIARVSPRLPASEVAKLSGGALRSYQAKLDRFNKGGSFVVIPDTGELVLRSVVSETLANFKKGKRTRQGKAAAIDRVFSHGIPSIAENARRCGARAKVFGHELNVEVKEDARTAKTWYRRLSRSREYAGVNWEKARRDTRFRYRLLLDKAGRTSLSNKIGNLRNDLFSVLANRTNFEEVIQLMYESSVRGLSDSADDYEDEAWEIVRAVERGSKVF